MNEWRLYAFADEASGMIDLQIQALKRNRLHGLEIRNVDGESVSSISIKKAKEVRKKLDDNGFIVWSIGSPIGKIGIDDPFSPHLDLLRHTMEVAAELNTKRIRMFSFYLSQGANPAEYRSKVMDQMAAMLETAQQYGIWLCHENEKGIYGDTAVRCKDLHDTFAELHGIFDPANYIQCGQNTWEAWQMLKEHIDYLHIKDALQDGSVVPAGHGVGRVGEILKEFAALGGKDLTLEPHLKVFDGLGKLERDGETSQIGQYVYETNDQAFDAACEALRALL